MPSNINLNGQELEAFSFQNNTDFNKSGEKKRENGYAGINLTESILIFREKLLQIPGNDKCADCGCPDAKWTSINLGVF